MSNTRKLTIKAHGIWKSVQGPNLNYGEFAIIRSQAVQRTSVTVLTKKDEDFIGFKPLEFEGFKTNAGFNSNEMQVITTSPALKQIKE